MLSAFSNHCTKVDAHKHRALMHKGKVCVSVYAEPLVDAGSNRARLYYAVCWGCHYSM